MLRGFEILRLFRVAVLDFRITFVTHNNRLYLNRILRRCPNPELIDDGSGISNTDRNTSEWLRIIMKELRIWN